VILRTAALTLLCCGLSACGAEPGAVSKNVGDIAPASVQAPAAVAASPTRTLGTSSRLSADTSALTGQVTDFQVTVTDTATIVALATDTLFAFDKANLQPGAMANLQRTADQIRSGGSGAISVEGHTDAKGEDAYNLALSQRRAEAVANWLRSQPDLNGRSFTVVGRGESKPVAPNTSADGQDDPEGRARNRRVEVIIPKR
jgi:outer membrane protein OmpA-like peptidoglycan-associated protein